MERDTTFTEVTFTVFDFNSHAHVERDLQLVRITKLLAHFNSHAHVERDVNPAERVNLFKISTHTLTWSVTLQPIEKGR